MRVVGHVLRARHLFLQQRGQEAMSSVFEALDDDTRRQFEEGIIETRWYPDAYLFDIVETADRVLGAGDLTLVEEMGAYSAELNIVGPLRGLIFRFGNPSWGLKFTPRAWRAQFDGGEMVTVEATSNAAHLELRAVPGGARPSLVAGVKGWLLKAVELFGAEVESWELELDQPEAGDATFRCKWW